MPPIHNPCVSACMRAKALINLRTVQVMRQLHFHLNRTGLLRQFRPPLLRLSEAILIRSGQELTP